MVRPELTVFKMTYRHRWKIRIYVRCFPKTHILYRNYYIHKKPFPPSIIFMYLWNILRKYIFSEFCGRNVTGQGYLNRSPIIHILNDFGNRQWSITDHCLNFIKPIPNTPYCLNINQMARIIFYLFSDVAHYNVIISGIWFFPNHIINLFLAEHSARILSEKLIISNSVYVSSTFCPPWLLLFVPDQWLYHHTEFYPADTSFDM